AVLRSIGAPAEGVPAAPAPPAPPPAAGPAFAAAGTATATCSPSVRRAARFTDSGRTPGRIPPAARTASSTRDPADRWYTPGVRTRPTTSTTRPTEAPLR